MAPPLTTHELWRRLFPNRTAAPFVLCAVMALFLLTVIYTTRVNGSYTQIIAVVLFALYALWQVFRKRDIDLLALLLGYLGLVVLLSFHRAEVIPLTGLMVSAALLSVVLTAWQGYRRFDRNALWRHAYLVGFMTAQLVAFFGFWFVFDDLIGKALLLTIVLYAVWGILESGGEPVFQTKSALGYSLLAILLGGVVLATMNPTLAGGIR